MKKNDPWIPTVWKLRQGGDRRFRALHPWIFSNELEKSPKGTPPGSWIELRDAQNQFLAWGVGNPHSLIAFREVSRRPDEWTSHTGDRWLVERLNQSWGQRLRSGFEGVSFRWVFGEADDLPGCVVDRYLLKDGHSQVVVVQLHTVSAEFLWDRMKAILPQILGEWSDQSCVVVRRDMGVRKWEGLELQPNELAWVGPRFLTQTEAAGDQEKIITQLQDLEFWIRSADPELSGKWTQAPSPVRWTSQPILMNADLWSGQKTGFFLDQFENIRQTLMHLLPSIRPSQKIRILDLCCYVGQWSTQLGKALQDRGIQVEVLLVDASEAALAFAKKNLKRYEIPHDVLHGDVLTDLKNLPAHQFDWVITDPPALIKSKKDVGPGTHAYLQLNTQSFRLLKEQGSIVSCSCSAQFEEEEFQRILIKAASRNQKRVHWLGRGMPSADHPMRLEFPEGRYLKAWIGSASSLGVCDKSQP